MEKSKISQYVMVIEILNRTGSRGLTTTVRVKFISDVKKSLIRNIKGPVRIGDIIMIKDTDKES